MTVRYKRTIDIIPPPASDVTPKQFVTQTRSIAWLIAEFEKDRFTGAIRSSLDTRKHRSAMLLYEGRVVGCIRSSFAGKTAYRSTEEALHAMLADLSLVGTEVSYYPLVDQVVLPLTGFFLGSLLNLDGVEAPAERIKLALDYIYQNAKTACLVGYYDDEIILSFFFEGLHHLSYSPGEIGFINELDDVGAIFERSSRVMVEAFESPPTELLMSREIGYRLSDIVR